MIEAKPLKVPLVVLIETELSSIDEKNTKPVPVVMVFERGEDGPFYYKFTDSHVLSPAKRKGR